jgi:pyruvate,orthophosphate dikinase
MAIAREGDGQEVRRPTKNPLLVSVRSGAAVSMPGMMDTVLNLGLNDERSRAREQTGNERFAYDAYRRLINMFGDVVMGVDHEHFEHAFDKIKKKYGASSTPTFPSRGLKELVRGLQGGLPKHTADPFPQNPFKQLELAIEAVFKSWDSPAPSQVPPHLNDITGLLGTAVNVQAMVFGNMGDDSGTGVASRATPRPARTSSTASS